MARSSPPAACTALISSPSAEKPTDELKYSGDVVAGEYDDLKRTIGERGTLRQAVEFYPLPGLDRTLFLPNNPEHASQPLAKNPPHPQTSLLVRMAGAVAGATAWDEDTARRFAIKKIAKGCWHAAEVPRDTRRRITLVPKFGAAAVGQYCPSSPYQVA